MTNVQFASALRSGLVRIGDHEQLRASGCFGIRRTSFCIGRHVDVDVFLELAERTTNGFGLF